MALTLTADERAELERRVRSLKIRSEDARRARVVLMLANGDSYSAIEATVPCYRDYINRWRRRFLADRLEGLRPRYRGQPPTILTAAMEARILDKTRQPPPDGSTHWSTRKLGRLLKIHHNLVAKAWQRAGLQPHRFERYMQPDDPDFETKAADVIGLYVNPPDHAVVFAVDEKNRDPSAGPSRSDPAAVARARGATRIRVLPPRHALAAGSARHEVWRSLRADGSPAHECRLCRVPPRHCGQPAEASGDPRHRGQLVDTQDPGGSHVPDGTPARAPALHADLFLVAQPSRALVCQDRTGSARARCVHLGRGPGPKNSALHQALQPIGETGPLELSQSGASN